MESKAFPNMMEYLLLRYSMVLHFFAHYDQYFVEVGGTGQIAKKNTLCKLQDSNPNIAGFMHSTQPEFLRISGVLVNIRDKGALVTACCEERVGLK